MNMKILLLSLGVAALCLTATPAMANMVCISDFGFAPLQGTYNHLTQDFTVSLAAGGSGTVYNSDATIAAEHVTGFNLVMKMDPSSGHGTGTLTVTDVDGDYIQGIVDGTWQKKLNKLSLDASTTSWTNVQFFSDDHFFNGTPGAVPIPANGLTGEGVFSVTALKLVSPYTQWFNPSGPTWTTSVGGSSDGDVSVVPIPGAVLLGFLGLSAAGLGLRKLA
jgi:hypothetical protein